MNAELSIAKDAAVEAGNLILGYYKADYEIKDKGRGEDGQCGLAREVPRPRGTDGSSRTALIQRKHTDA